MKNFKTLTLALTFLLAGLNVSAQNYCMTAPVGYGAGTTGGGSGATVTVTSESALKSALGGSTPVILVSGTINITSMIKLKVTNKTILGLPGARIKALGQTTSSSGGIYFSSGSSNIIVRNLIFEGPGAYDCDGNDLLCADGTTKLWVDHCDFQDGCDGNFDNKGLTDNVTISWCKFHYLKPPKSGGSGGTNDHRFTNLVGSSSSDKPSDGKYSMTWMNCYWAQGCVERMTRARNAQLHFLNCYWNSSVAKCNLGLENVTAYVENCTFTASSSVIYKSYGGTNTVKFAGCVGSVPSNIGNASAPTYAYTPMASSETVSALTNSTCGVGATLQVSTSGVVSSPCSTPIVNPTLNITSGAASQSITLGAAITSIVYTYGGTATGATVTGLPAGVTATSNTSAKTITISGTPSASGTSSFTVKTTQSSGTAVSLSGSIAVSAAIVQPTLSLTSGGSAQTITLGNAISPITYTYGGSATGATVSGLPAGVTATTNTTAKTVVISGTPTATGTSNFTLTTTQSSGTALTKTGSIVVNAQAIVQPTLTLISGSKSQNITIGGAITPIEFEYGGSATHVNITGLSLGLSATQDSIAKTVVISGTPTAIGSVSYTISTSQTSGTAVSQSGTITISDVVVVTGITESFNAVTATILSTGSDKTQDVVTNGLTWKVEKARLNTNASYSHTGNNSIRLMYGTGAIITPLLKGTQTVTFWIAKANANYSPNLAVYKSIDGGATWVSTAVLTAQIPSTTYTMFSVNLTESGENVKLKIVNKGGISASTSYNAYIDDISFTPSSSARSASVSDDYVGASSFKQIGNELVVENAGLATIAVYAVSGNLITSAENCEAINISALNNGVYVAIAKTASGEVLTLKFIK